MSSGQISRDGAVSFFLDTSFISLIIERESSERNEEKTRKRSDGTRD